MNLAHKLITQTHDDTKRRHCGPLYFGLYRSQTEIGRDPTIRVTVPLFGETPFFPPYLPLCLNPSPPIPSPPRPLSSTMNEGCWGTTHLFTTPMLI